MTHAFFSDALKAHQPEVLTIGAVREVMSRRKARKLAYQYRGGNRGKRYAAFLAGHQLGFWVEGKRLVRPPKFSKTTTIITLHAEGTSGILERLNTTPTNYSFEDPLTFD